MPRKTETPKDTHRDPNADATDQPWSPRGRTNSPGKRPGGDAPDRGARTPSSRKRGQAR